MQWYAPLFRLFDVATFCFLAVNKSLKSTGQNEIKPNQCKNLADAFKEGYKKLF